MYNRGRGRWSNSANKNRSSAGYEAAKKHIREARILSDTLGGTDRTVKKYLFGLSGAELNSVLDQYGRRYGEVAKSYALETMPRWRSGKVQMSGMVAERLYSFLPQKMPLKTKYEIAEELWRHVGPSSSKTLRFGPGVALPEIVTNSEDYISKVVVEYKIPAALERRFDWLASEDVSVKQQLLNHLRTLDKKLVVEAVRLQSGLMLKQLHEDHGKRIKHFTHTVTVGKHTLKIIADHDMDGCKFEEYRTIERYARSGTDYSWLGWLVAAAIVIGLIILANTQ